MSNFKAFISCSLRPEDSKFVQFIEDYLKSLDVIPFGTVGRHKASTQNPVKLMKTNILESDFIVMCATTRYIQKDIKGSKESSTISEMLQFEAGIAHANEKPIIVFVEDDVNIGSALPNITQYVRVRKIAENYSMDDKIAQELIDYAKNVSSNNADWEIIKGISAIALGGFAAYGLFKAFEKSN